MEHEWKLEDVAAIVQERHRIIGNHPLAPEAVSLARRIVGSCVDMAKDFKEAQK